MFISACSYKPGFSKSLVKSRPPEVLYLVTFCGSLTSEEPFKNSKQQKFSSKRDYQLTTGLLPHNGGCHLTEWVVTSRVQVAGRTEGAHFMFSGLHYKYTYLLGPASMGLSCICDEAAFRLFVLTRSSFLCSLSCLGVLVKLSEHTVTSEVGRKVTIVCNIVTAFTLSKTIF